MGDIYSDQDRVESAFRLLKQSNLTESNKCHLEDFAEFCMAQNLSDHKIYRYLQSFRVLSSDIGFDLEEADRCELVQLVGKINRNNIDGKDYEPQSRAEIKKALLKYYSFSENSVDTGFISCNVKKSDRKLVDPDRLPTPKTVKSLKKHAKNLRDKLLIVLLWETGARIGEFLNLDWKDLTDKDDYFKVRLSGKTGQRFVPVVHSYNLIKNWKVESPSGSAVFTSFQGGDRLQYRAAYRAIQRAAERLGTDLKHNPHAFRKSRATFLASKGLNAYQLMQFFGWNRPETATRYIRMSQSDLDDLVLDISRQSQLEEFEEGELPAAASSGLSDMRINAVPQN